MKMKEATRGTPVRHGKRYGVILENDYRLNEICPIMYFYSGIIKWVSTRSLKKVTHEQLKEGLK